MKLIKYIISKIPVHVMCWMCVLRKRCQPESRGWIENKYIKYAICENLKSPD